MNMPDQQVPAGPGMDPQEVVRAVEEFTRNPPPEVVERLRETAEESRRRRQTPWSYQPWSYQLGSHQRDRFTLLSRTSRPEKATLTNRIASQ